MEDEYFRRFTIDNSLKRYAPALRHLCLCRPVKTEQIIRYMKLHRIFTPAIDELCSTPILEEAKQALQMAATLQAETLKSRDSCEEAGYLYQRVELYDEALTCFQKCGLSQQCLALASILQFRWLALFFLWIAEVEVLPYVWIFTVSWRRENSFRSWLAIFELPRDTTKLPLCVNTTWKTISKVANVWLKICASAKHGL